MRTISLMRGPFQVCDACYEMIIAEKLVDDRNVASDHDAVFDHVVGFRESCPRRGVR